MLNPARDMGMVSGRRMNWEQSRRALKAPGVPWRCRKQSRNVAEQQGQPREVGIAELGGRHCPFKAPVICNEAWGCVDKVGDAPLGQRKYCREALMGPGWNSVAGTGRRSALAEFRLGAQGSMAWAAEQSEGSGGL